MPMKMPESPMRLFSSVPNLLMAPIQVPYTPEKKVNSRPLEKKIRFNLTSHSHSPCPSFSSLVVAEVPIHEANR